MKLLSAAFFCFFFSLNSICQDAELQYSSDLLEKPAATFLPGHLFELSLDYQFPEVASFLFFRRKPSPTDKLSGSLSKLLLNSYLESLGFFCKFDVKVEKSANMPLKFRLGEVGYVRQLEKK
jgi:hypothetical protein